AGPLRAQTPEKDAPAVVEAEESAPSAPATGAPGAPKTEAVTDAANASLRARLVGDPSAQSGSDRPLTVSAGFSHLSGFYENTEPVTSLFAAVTYRFDADQWVSAAQSFNQYYRVNPG